MCVSTVGVPDARGESISRLMDVAAVGGIVFRVSVELHATFPPSFFTPANCTQAL